MPDIIINFIRPIDITMMRSLFFLLSFVLGSAAVMAQAPSIQWQRSLGGTGVDATVAVVHTADSGYMVLSYSGSTDGDATYNHGRLDCWLVKLTAWGDVVWQKSIGGSDNEISTGLQQTNDGGYIVCVNSRSTDGDVTLNHGGEDAWIVKLDDTGKIQWQRSYGGSGKDVPQAIQQTTDGGYIVAGYSTSSDGDVTTNRGGNDYWLLKLTATGDITWEQTYGGSDDDVASAVQQTTDGGYIIGGSSASTDGDVTGNHGGDDYWIVKISATGTIQWQHSYGGSGDDDIGDESFAGSIQQTFDGGYVTTGTTNSADGDVTGYHGGLLFDFWTLKISATGAIEWQKTNGSGGDDDGYCVQQTKDSGYVVCGTSNGNSGDVSGNHGTYDYWLIKLSPAGNLLWEQSYGGTLDEYDYFIRPTSDSEFILGGYSASNNMDVTGNHGGYDGWVVKLGYCSLPHTAGITGPTIVCAGSGIVLSDNTAGGAWSVSNGNATVADSVLTGVYPGRVAVSYAITNGCGTGGTIYIVNVSAAPAPVIVNTNDTLSTTLSYSTYQWLQDGTPIAGATNATYVYTSAGTYSVTVTDSNGCSGTADGFTEHPAGVNNISGSTGIAIIPNPTTGMLYISGVAQGSVKVYNAIGQQVKSIANTGSFSLTELPAGIYLVRVFDAQGVLLKQEKIVKE
jgi:hypothetical protein